MINSSVDVTVKHFGSPSNPCRRGSQHMSLIPGRQGERFISTGTESHYILPPVQQYASNYSSYSCRANSNVSLAIGRSYSPVTVLTLTDLTRPSSAGYTFKTLPIFQNPRFSSGFMTSTKSPTSILLLSFHHLLCNCKDGRKLRSHTFHHILTTSFSS